MWLLIIIAIITLALPIAVCFIPVKLTLRGFVNFDADVAADAASGGNGGGAGAKQFAAGDIYLDILILRLFCIRVPRQKLLRTLFRRLRRRKEGGGQLRRKAGAATAAALRYRGLFASATAGAGDSAATAIFIGAVYAALAVAQAFLCVYTGTPKKACAAAPFNISISPAFEKLCLAGSFNCIFSLKPVNIIIEYLKALKGR